MLPHPRAIIVLFLVFGLLSSVIGLSFASSGKTTLVVQPWRGNAENDAAVQTANILRQKLKELLFLYIVEPGNADAVLAYHAGYKIPSHPILVEEAESWLNRAKEHYFDFAFSESQSELQQVLTLFEKNPDLLLDAGELLLDTYVTKALVDSAAKETSAVEDDFQKILSWNPLFNLEAKNFSPSFRKIFEEVKADFLQNATSKLVIKSDPKAVDVYLNGIYQGVTPLTLFPLPSQEYRLRFVANHYLSLDKKIVLKNGETFSLHPKMAWSGTRLKKEENRSQTREGLRIAELLKTDKVLLVDVGKESMTARLVDRRYRASHIPIIMPVDAGEPTFQQNLEKMVRLIAAQTQLDLTKNPQAHLDPDGMGDPILLAKRRKKIPKGYWYGGLGAIGIGGLVAGILAASGGSSAPQTGSVSLNFK